MAARLREALGVDVEEQSGGYGEFTVLVDGVPVTRGNPIAIAFAVVPSEDEVIGTVRERLRETP